LALLCIFFENPYGVHWEPQAELMKTIFIQNFSRPFSPQRNPETSSIDDKRENETSVIGIIT
jgi:hypothetical protein